MWRCIERFLLLFTSFPMFLETMLIFSTKFLRFIFMNIWIIKALFCFRLEKRISFHSPKWFMHSLTCVFLLIHWENVIIFNFNGYGIICCNRSGNGLGFVYLWVRWLFAFHIRYLVTALGHVVISMMWFFYFRFTCQISWLNDVHGLNWVNKVIGKHSVSIRNLLCWW